MNVSVLPWVRRAVFALPVSDQEVEIERLQHRVDVFGQFLDAAIPGHTCLDCGESFDFTADSDMDDYVELQRFIGFHGRCVEVAEAIGRGQAMLVKAMTEVYSR